MGVIGGCRVANGSRATCKHMTKVIRQLLNLIFRQLIFVTYTPVLCRPCCTLRKFVAYINEFVHVILHALEYWNTWMSTYLNTSMWYKIEIYLSWMSDFRVDNGTRLNVEVPIVGIPWISGEKTYMMSLLNHEERNWNLMLGRVVQLCESFFYSR